jgi:phage terminase small subunit
MSKKLTAKQQRFVEFYILYNCNATKAALSAGYSEKSAYSIGSENLRKPEIRQALDDMMSASTMGAKEVLFRLTEQARADIFDVVDSDGQLNMLKARSRRKTGLIKSITHTTVTIKDVETRTVRVELHDTQKALQLLGKYHKLFVDRVQVDDWRSQAIEDIKAGVIDYETLADAFDSELAQELFRAAGVSVVIGDHDESSGLSG